MEVAYQEEDLSNAKKQTSGDDVQPENMGDYESPQEKEDGDDGGTARACSNGHVMTLMFDKPEEYGKDEPWGCN